MLIGLENVGKQKRGESGGVTFAVLSRRVPVVPVCAFLQKREEDV